MLEGVGLLDWQPIHIGSQAHRARRIANPKPADDACRADPAMDLAAELAKLRGDKIGSAPFFEPELGVGVNVAAPVC